MSRPADPKARSFLLRAARERFVRDGLKGARIEDITKACGLSKGAFYLHFSSKEALFGQVLREFKRRMKAVVLTRHVDVGKFFQTEGLPTAADVRQQAPRYLRYIELTKQSDMAILELCWEYRDIVHVMVRGVQGTAFEGKGWSMLKQALTQLERQKQRFEERGTFREGVAEGLVPAMLVGTYFMLCFQMADMKKKPNFSAWVYGLNRLLHEGCTPLFESYRQWEPFASPAESQEVETQEAEPQKHIQTPLLSATKGCGLGAEKTKRRNS